MKSVSLITTVFNEAENIERFLESYREQSVYADEFIIVDGGSNDGTTEIINKFATMFPTCKIHLVIDKSCSRKYSSGPIAQGRNNAISLAKGNIIAVTDAGCVLDENWLKEIVAPFGDEQVDVVAGWYEPMIGNLFQARYAEVMLSKKPNIGDDFLPSSRSIAFHKSCWEVIGGYPTETFTAEDTMFDLRLKERGFRFFFNGDAYVYWECPRNLREAIKKEYLYSFGDGQWHIFREWYSDRLKELFFPIKFVLNRKFQLKKNIALKFILMTTKVVGYKQGEKKAVR
jgi:glycosyltransferase involved in cell wall biosynthesis